GTRVTASAPASGPGTGHAPNPPSARALAYGPGTTFTARATPAAAIRIRTNSATCACCTALESALRTALVKKPCEGTSLGPPRTGRLITVTDVGLRLLREVFGLDQFRPGQAPVVTAQLAARDVLPVARTGPGKTISSCFPELPP